MSKSQSIKHQLSSSKTNCCVVGCSNSYYNTDGSITLYSFPNKWYEVERKKQWIDNIRRVNADNTQWKPKAFSRVCSAHFVGNIKSNHPHSPSFHPTIFPKVYNKKASSNDVDKHDQSQRTLNGLKVKVRQEDYSSCKESNVNSSMATSRSDFCCQTDNTHFEDQGFWFECNFHTDLKNNLYEVSTQVRISARNNCEKQDKCVGN